MRFETTVIPQKIFEKICKDWEKGLNINQLSSKYHIGRYSIANRLSESGYDNVPPSFVHKRNHGLDKAKAIALFKSGRWTIEDIARECNSDKITIQDVIADYLELPSFDSERK